MGNYADPPARRLAYDTDGTRMMEVQGASVATWTLGQRQGLNDESVGAPFDGNATPLGSRPGLVAEVFLFPSYRTISHLYINTGSRTDTVSSIQYSTDTTTGLDGTWTTVAWSNTGIQNDNAIGAFRAISSGGAGIKAWVATNVKAIRINTNYRDGNDSLRMVHIYGTRGTSDPTRNVGFVDATPARFVKDFDWGDLPWGHTYKWKSPTLYNMVSECYVKNFSATQQANTVVLSVEALTGAMPAATAMSLDDVTYSSPLALGNIAALAVVGPIFVRWAPPNPSSLGVFAERLKLAVTSWT